MQSVKSTTTTSTSAPNYTEPCLGRLLPAGLLTTAASVRSITIAQTAFAAASRMAEVQQQHHAATNAAAAAVAAAAAASSGAPYQEIFQKAVRSGDTHELQRILQRWEGAVNVNLFDQEGQTALHQSCMDGNLELVKLLVKFGADVKLANRDGWSALHIAAYGGHQDIALYLISNSRR